jgi:5'-nucleotidase
MKSALTLTLVALLVGGCVVKKTKNSEVMDLTDTPQSESTTALEPLTTTTPPAQVAPLQAEPSPAQGARTHVIAAGDTPWNIAVRYYGDGKQANKILEANPGLVATRMPIGKKINIP